MDRLIKASEHHDNESEYQEDGVLLLEPEKTELKPPPMYKVLMLDDDFTPMDFVVEVLEQFFSLSREKATEIMLEVHNAGRGVCGVFTKDVAETKAALVIDHARAHNHPLYCKAEPDHNT